LQSGCEIYQEDYFVLLFISEKLKTNADFSGADRNDKSINA
jgi:hypothetical protein